MKKLFLILAISSLCLIGILLLPERITYTPPGTIVPGDIIHPGDSIDNPADPAMTSASAEPGVIPGVIIAGDTIPPGDSADAPADPATTPAHSEPRVIPEVIIAKAIVPPADVTVDPAAPATAPASTEPDVIIAKVIIPPGDSIADPAAPAATPTHTEPDVIPGVSTTQAKTINPDDLVQNWGPWARIAPAAGGSVPAFSQESRDYNIVPELLSYTYTEPGVIPGVIIPPGDIDDPTDPGATSPYRENVRVREQHRTGAD